MLRTVRCELVPEVNARTPGMHGAPSLKAAVIAAEDGTGSRRRQRCCAPRRTGAIGTVSRRRDASLVQADAQAPPALDAPAPAASRSPSGGGVRWSTGRM